MKLRLKKTQEVCSSSSFNTHAVFEIIVYGEDWCDTDYPSNYDAWIEALGEWKDLKDAFRDKDVISDNYDTRFFEPPTPEDRERGFTL